MVKFIDIKQGTPEWHEFRRTHIGASEIATIMGENPYQTPYQLWLLKKGKDKEIEPNEHMIRGKTLEPQARGYFSAILGIMFEPKVCVYEKWEFASASLDGISPDNKILLEAKAPARPLDKLSRAYKYQMQWQMMCVGEANKCHLGWFIDKTVNGLFEEDPDPILWEKMLEAAKDFKRCIDEDIPPEIKEKDYLLIEDEKFNELSLKLATHNEKKKEHTDAYNAIKKELLEFTDDGNVRGKYLSISSIPGRKTYDLEKLKKEYNISDQDFAKYEKYSANSWRINIFKEEEKA